MASIAGFDCERLAGAAQGGGEEVSAESSWLKLDQAHHFALTETRPRRCQMCRKLIKAGERYFGSTTVDYSGAIRFHRDCAAEYAERIYT
jgi:hypothetical protein